MLIILYSFKYKQTFYYKIQLGIYFISTWQRSIPFHEKKIEALINKRRHFLFTKILCQFPRNGLTHGLSDKAKFYLRQCLYSMEWHVYKSKQYIVWYQWLVYSHHHSKGCAVMSTGIILAFLRFPVCFFFRLICLGIPRTTQDDISYTNNVFHSSILMMKPVTFLTMLFTCNMQSLTSLTSQHSVKWKPQKT